MTHLTHMESEGNIKKNTYKKCKNRNFDEK